MGDNKNNDNDLDFREVVDGEIVDTDKKDSDSQKETDKSGASDSKDKTNTDNNENQYEDVCFVCRRPESKAGKMFHLPNNICICDDCMHKTMDTVSQFDYQNLLNNPNLMNELNKNSNGFPNISFMNMNDFQNMGGIPNSQKIKKKKEKEPKVKPEFDIKNIPAPHKIKAKLDDYVIGQEQAKKIISVA
nr:ATP-dependent Clp protease ATP-binding subunit ClpX [Butyrivibrio sp.]